MRVVLHSDFKLAGRSLFDGAIGARYMLSSDSAWLLKQIKKESRISALVARVSQAKNITKKEAELAFYNLAGQINSFGGIVVGRSVLQKLTPRRAYATWNTRHQGTLKGFMAGMAQAYGLLALLTTTLFAAIKFVDQGALPALWVLLPAMLTMSCIVHEAGHALAAKNNKVPFVFLSHIGYAAILYVKPARGVARRIAITGPLLSGAFCLGVALVLADWPLRLCLATACILQLCSLLPFFADGRVIWRK